MAAKEPMAVNLAALVWAAAHGKLSFVQHCFDQLPMRKRRRMSHDVVAAANRAFQRAVLNGHMHVVQYLCELPPCFGVNPGASNNAALSRAAAQGHLGIMQYLCKLSARRRVRPPANALFDAIHCARSLDAVRLLCELPEERGVDPAASDNRALEEAIEIGRLDIVRYLCELPTSRGVNPGGLDSYALQLAVSKGHLHIVRYLCELPANRGVDAGACDNCALQDAVELGRLDIVQYLCGLPTRRGVDPSVHNNMALRTAMLHRAAFPIVQFLCELPPCRGVVPGAALTLAARRGDVDAVRYLCQFTVERGVSSNLIHDALRVAAANGNFSVVRFLCEELHPTRPVDPTANNNAALRQAAKGSAYGERLSGCRAVLWFLYDVSAVAQATPSWRLANATADTFAKLWCHSAPSRMLLFLVRALPGGDQWLDHGGAFQQQELERLATEREGVFRTLLVEHRRRLAWRRRRTPLLLRALRDKQRGRPRASVRLSRTPCMYLASHYWHTRSCKPGQPSTKRPRITRIVSLPCMQ